MKIPEAERDVVIAQMNDLRNRSYATVTRGWWWRGAAVGFCGGVVVGLLLIALLAWLAENL